MPAAAHHASGISKAKRRLLNLMPPPCISRLYRNRPFRGQRRPALSTTGRIGVPIGGDIRTPSVQKLCLTLYLFFSLRQKANVFNTQSPYCGSGPRSPTGVQLFCKGEV